MNQEASVCPPRTATPPLAGCWGRLDAAGWCLQPSLSCVFRVEGFCEIFTIFCSSDDGPTGTARGLAQAMSPAWEGRALSLTCDQAGASWPHRTPQG